MSARTAPAVEARTAADLLVGLLPSTVPLAVTPLAPGAGPGPSETAVVATFVGATSVELVLVAERAVAESLTGQGGAPVSLADALRPALEAASTAFGPGVLDVAEVRPVGGDLTGEALTAFSLVADGAPQAWFGVRTRAQKPGVIPSQRTGGSERVPSAPADLRLLYDVEMTLTAEIGRTRLPVRQVLELVPGSVLELDRAAGAPADLMVNGRLIARGEVVVVDEDYGIRITEIIAPEQAAG
ncbi:flagellar motor switch protein FliN [Cellulomonas sp. ATA003]|uniref:flagellar motor switch protein FliN n=1 Tax=Cellulomonas sp. ATA003 TaxID=3073064 RepID=UPI002873A349|nr:flagellar motor switch protein FliN [Cellulomonas sp. ATA003]WNB85231.1 flagellar motor switch protein FliN [Cellulomonas sp. ATA003]